MKHPMRICGTFGHRTFTSSASSCATVVDMINRRRRRMDLGEVALTAALLSVFASARGTALALGAARALLP
jgi:hypothetical protein